MCPEASWDHVIMHNITPLGLWRVLWHNNHKKQADDADMTMVPFMDQLLIEMDG